MKWGGSRGRVRERLEEAVRLALNPGKGYQHKESKWPLEAGKEGNRFLPRAYRRNMARLHLDFCPVKCSPPEL